MDILLSLLAAAVGGFVRGLTGLGQNLVVIPVLSSAFGVADAIVIMSIGNVATNALHWRLARGAERVADNLGFMAAIGMATTVVGTFALRHLDGRYLSLLVGAITVSYVLTRTVRPQRPTSGGGRSSAVGPAVAGVAGLVQGAAGISGPVVATYLNRLGLSRRGFVFSAAVLFQGFAAAQALTLFGLGLYSTRLLLLSCACTAVLLGALGAGELIGRRLNARAFDGLILAFLAIMGLRLIVDALR